MARKSNVNPNHYKTAGREPQGQAVLQAVERQKLREGQVRLSRKPAGLVTAPLPKKASKAPAAPPKARPTKAVEKQMDENLQASHKRGKVFMAQKRAGVRYGLNSTPSTRPVAGAYGKRKAAAQILAEREAYDSSPAKKKAAASAKRK